MNPSESVLKIALDGLRGTKPESGTSTMPRNATTEERSALFLQLQYLQDALPRARTIVARPIHQNGPTRL